LNLNYKDTLKALAITIFGAALWEMLLSKFFNKLTFIFLNLITLGSEKTKNYVYQEIAKGFREIASITVYDYFIGFLSGIFIISLVLYLKDLSKSSENKVGSINKNSLLETYFLIIVLIFGLIFNIANNIKISYENAAITHFYQCLDIVSPFISEKENRLYLSKFRRVKTKDNYQEILNSFELYSKPNNLELPKFKIW